MKFINESKPFTIQDFNKVYGEIDGIRCLIDKLPALISDHEMIRFRSLAGENYQAILNDAIDAYLLYLKGLASSTSEASKLHSETSIANELKNKKSVYNRDLLDRAADEIERLKADVLNLKQQNKALEEQRDYAARSVAPDCAACDREGTCEFAYTGEKNPHECFNFDVVKRFEAAKEKAHCSKLIRDAGVCLEATSDNRFYHLKRGLQERLTSYERAIVEMTYGINGNTKRPDTDIAIALNLALGQVNIMRIVALKKLRNFFSEVGFHEDFR